MEPLPSTDPRTTKGITHEQRYYLCLKKQECPAMKQSELAAWFLETYSFSISQPTISHSLKKSAEILIRGISTPGLEPTRVRRRPVRHPELELALFHWVQQQQQQAQGLGQGQAGDSSETISGPAVIRQAKKIAEEMNIQDTVFCPGWLSRFKMRYGLAPSRGSNQLEHQHRHHPHHHHHQHPHQRRHRHHQLPEQDQQQRQQQQQSAFEAPPPPQIINSITISNHSCSPPPSADYSTPDSNTIAPRNTLDNTTLGTIDIRPSIAVPANINSSHASLQQLRPQHTGFGAIHILPSPGEADRQPLHQQRQQQLQSQQQHQQHQHHHQDAQLLQQFRMQTYQPSPPRHTHLHSHNQQQQQLQRHTLTDFPAVSAVSSTSTTTAPTEITAAMHLEFLQSIPITTPTNGNVPLLHVPPSLPPSPLSHHTSGSHIRPINDPFQSTAIAAPRIDAAVHSTPSSSSSSSSPMERPGSGFKLDSVITLGKVQTLQDAQRLVQLLRQYAGSNLQDPTGALKCLESLEWELDPTRMRGSITISEVGDDED